MPGEAWRYDPPPPDSSHPPTAPEPLYPTNTLSSPLQCISSLSSMQSISSISRTLTDISSGERNITDALNRNFTDLNSSNRNGGMTLLNRTMNDLNSSANHRYSDVNSCNRTMTDLGALGRGMNPLPPHNAYNLLPHLSTPSPSWDTTKWISMLVLCMNWFCRVSWRKKNCKSFLSHSVHSISYAIFR